MSELKASSSIIEVYDDHLVCKLCEPPTILMQSGSHFHRIHGLPLSKSLSRLERLRIYGLPMGTRLTTKRLLEKYVELGKERAVNLTPLTVETAGTLRKVNRGGMSSFAQKESFQKLIGSPRHGSQVRKERAATEGKCVVCGAFFMYVKHRSRKICSAECNKQFSKLRFEQFNVNLTEEQRANRRKALSEARRKKRWSSRKALRYYIVHRCLNCQTKFTRTASNSNPNVFCSLRCYHAYASIFRGQKTVRK